MCSRIDFFSEERVDDYGLELKNQIEERLVFLANGQKPRKNIDVMKQVYEKLKNKEMENNGDAVEEDLKLLNKKKKKGKRSEELVVEQLDEVVVEKKKKREVIITKEEVQVEEVDVEKPKKKKKSK